MNRNHLYSLFVSTFVMWAICYMFNSTTIAGKVVFAKAFINPWLTFTTVSKYFELGMSLNMWVAHILAAALLLFIWVSLYMFVLSVMRAMDAGRKRH